MGFGRQFPISNKEFAKISENLSTDYKNLSQKDDVRRPIHITKE